MSKEISNSEAPLYVDLIIPIAVPKLLSYHLSQGTIVNIGQRVLVNVGKNKQYSAIVYRVHNEKPSYLTKQVLEVLDDEPIVNSKQLELWSWISRYYMTTMGEVMMASSYVIKFINIKSTFVSMLDYIQVHYVM